MDRMICDISSVLEINNLTFPFRLTSFQTVVTEPQISTAPLAPESENEKRNQTSSTPSIGVVK